MRREPARPISRVLLVRGRDTAHRVHLPDFGCVTVGSSPDDHLVVMEPGVVSKHLELTSGFGVEVRVAQGQVVHLERGGASEPRRGPGAFELLTGDRVTLGGAELSLVGAPAGRFTAHPTDRAELEGALARAEVAAVGALRVRGVGAAEAEPTLLAAVPAVAHVAALGPGLWAVAGLDAEATALGGWLTEAADGLAALGLAVELGLATPGDPDRVDSAVAALQVRERDEPVARSPAMQAALRLLARAAEGDEPVLLLGETGVGKERLARQLHQRSRRAAGPFVKLDCGSLDPARLAEPRPFASASGGTLLLDEVAGLPAELQLALAQALERAPEDARVVATSNEDLPALAREGRFRSDLFYRLDRIRISVPALRGRPEDIGPLAEQILARGRARVTLSSEARRALEGHGWPGNIRELDAVLSRAALALDGPELELRHLPLEHLGVGTGDGAASSAAGAPRVEAVSTEPQGSLRDEMAALEKRRMTQALDRYGNQQDAARALGIPIRTFTNRMDALGIPRARGRQK